MRHGFLYPLLTLTSVPVLSPSLSLISSADICEVWWVPRSCAAAAAGAGPTEAPACPGLQGGVLGGRSHPSCYCLYFGIISRTIAESGGLILLHHSCITGGSSAVYLWPLSPPLGAPWTEPADNWAPAADKSKDALTSLSVANHSEKPFTIGGQRPCPSHAALSRLNYLIVRTQCPVIPLSSELHCYRLTVVS